ncbi:MAG: hypothetical protein ACP5KA_04570 [Desulfurococcaceae archaeon]
MSALLELGFFAANAFLLLLEGYSDYRFRGVPVVVLGVHGALAAASVLARALLMGLGELPRAYLGLAVVLAMLLVLYTATGLVGGGDVLVVLVSGALSPQVPVGYLRGLSLTTPIALLAASSYLYLKFRRSTSTVYIKGVGKIRARVRYVVDLKKGVVESEYPVYIEGYGRVPLSALKSREELMEVLEKAGDYSVAYTVPHYPFVLYYAVAFPACYLLLCLASLVIGVVLPVY